MRLHLFDIQRFSVQDGPGIRTSVFLKGCGVGCLWCHNPESIAEGDQLLFYGEKCVGCGACQEACPQGVHRLTAGEHLMARSSCIACGSCARVCPQGALEIAGYWMEPKALLEKILRDRPFYEATGGGVTFSGGEPLLQAEALAEVLKGCRAAGVHTAIETSGAVGWEKLQVVLAYTDLFLYDLKCGSDARHRQVTNLGNRGIQANLLRLFAQSKPVWVRIPVIPGVNDSPEEVRQMAGIIRQGSGAVQRVELLPYHDTGKSKYAALGWEYAFEAAYGACADARERAEAVRAMLEEEGVAAAVS